METKKICPGCRKPLAADALDELCPECLMRAGFGSAMEPGPDSRSASGRVAFVAPSVEEVGRLFPQLEVLGFIGRGGMGAVYKARQKSLDRVVALKILPPRSGDDPAFAERFTQEAKALAKLLHSNIVTLFEFGQVNGIYYLLMEYVDGVSLGQLLSSGRVSPREALAIVPQICDALQYAHDHGIVHRDIKPENILLDRRGSVKVADFGLAKMVESQPAGARSAGSDGGTPAATPAANLTAEGKIMGTPRYMSPEQFHAPGEVDHRADIYALGVVFYQMLTGELPGKPIEPPSRKVHIDVRLDAVVLRALEQKAELRYQQASQVKTIVETIASHDTIHENTAGLLPGELAGVARSCDCYISSPERSRKFWGRFYIYEGKGGLQLSAAELVFSSNKEALRIPLRAIRNLHIGHYPRLAKPARLDYISITYEEEGNYKTRWFTPAWSGFSAVWTTNRVVNEWFYAIKAALLKVQGETVASDRPKPDSDKQRPESLFANFVPPGLPGNWFKDFVRPPLGLVALVLALAVTIVLAKQLLRAGDPDTTPQSPTADGSISFGGQDWLPWRTLFAVKGDKVVSLPRPRPGFDYGSDGGGRGPLLFSNIGNRKWKDYRAEFEFCVTGIDPSFNPDHLPSGYHDGEIWFHVADAKESWNERGASAYVLGVHGDGTWFLRGTYNEYCAVPRGFGLRVKDGERELAEGAGLKPDRENGNKYTIEVKGQRIRVWMDGEKFVDVTDERMGETIGGQTLDHGGIGFAWGYDAMGWVRNFSLSKP